MVRARVRVRLAVREELARLARLPLARDQRGRVLVPNLVRGRGRVRDRDRLG